MKETIMAVSIWINIFFSIWVATDYYFRRTDTIYASGYSESKFREISCLTDQKRVKELLGDPLYEILMTHNGDKIRRIVVDTKAQKGPQFTELYDKASDIGRVYWVYSESGLSSDNYSLRGVQFDTSGRIIDIVQEEYLD